MSDSPERTSAGPVRTPRVEETLARAAQLATAMGHNYVGTEHLLLALVDDPDGIAGQVLNRAGRAQSLRQELQSIIDDPLYRQTSHRIYR